MSWRSKRTRSACCDRRLYDCRPVNTLFATTALVGFAGAAAAEISVSGSANMGVKYDESATQEMTVHHEIDFGINASGETDGGLTFGASVDIDTDNSSGAFGGADGEVYIGGAFGTLTVGKVDAADDQYFGAIEVGFDGIGLDDEAEAGYGGGTHDALYTYSMGDFSVAISGNTDNGNDSVAAGIQYKGPVTIALGYNDDGTNSALSLGVTGSMGQFGYNLAYVDHDASGQAYGLGGSYKVSDALTIKGGVADNDGASDASYGVGFDYSLGGGATLAGGLGSIDGNVKADFGVNMSF